MFLSFKQEQLEWNSYTLRVQVKAVEVQIWNHCLFDSLWHCIAVTPIRLRNQLLAVLHLIQLIDPTDPARLPDAPLSEGRVTAIRNACNNAGATLAVLVPYGEADGMLQRHTFGNSSRLLNFPDTDCLVFLWRLFFPEEPPKGLLWSMLEEGTDF